MKTEALEKPLKGVCTSLCEIRTKAIPPHIFHLVFVGERRNGTCGVISVEGFVKEDEVSETAADSEGGLLKCFEIRLK